MDKRRLNYLFGRYFDKTATEQECNELMVHIENCDSDDELAVQLQHLYTLQMQENNGLEALEAAKLSDAKTEEILDFILKPNPSVKPLPVVRRKLQIWQQVAAAVFILVVAGTALWYWQGKINAAQIMSTDQLTHIKPGGNKAILTLADGTKIDLDAVKDGEIASSHGIKILKADDGKLIYEILPSDTKDNKDAFNTISTPRGGQYQVKLPDGTQVWLNASSSLRYPIRFANTERRVELDGEGYFEVMKNPAAPFRVVTRNQNITVLGTHFNINSYEDEADVLTTVLEGSVKVSPTVAGQELSGQSEVLKINQQAVLNNKSKQVKVKEVLATSFIAWKMGKFQFQQTHIADVMRQLSRWYNVDFRYEGKLPDIFLSGDINRNVDAAEALEILKFFDLKYAVEYGQNHKKVIVIR